MQKFIDLRSGREFSPRSPSVLCLGTFDGVHLGHAALLAETVRQKDALSKLYPDIVGGAWCFSQPPADFLLQGHAEHILTLEDKLQLFYEAGLDIAVVGDFPSMKNIKKDDFVNDILIRDCRCVKSICGPDFRFGHRAEGTPRDLSLLGNITVDAVLYEGEAVSSSRIRRLIRSGEIEKANALLGRPYFITLPIEHGKALGRKLGAPTANQLIPEHLAVPKHGVYVTLATVGGTAYTAVTNVGTNPTVGGGAVKAETHIIGFDGDIYGEAVKIEFLSFIRPEKKFSDKSDLSKAIRSDIEAAQKYFDI
ncbi:MAG: riboflavin biosynthesis protein RibF [Ruminococcaceae bacterium]|nr:riboflavin biosynthesis protein RibF [Oscillospiraceae bacterium]